MRAAWRAAAVLLASGLLDPGARAAVLWRHPPDRLVVDGAGVLHAVLELKDEDPEGVTMGLNGRTIPPARPPSGVAGGFILHYRFQLSPGLNTLEVAWRTGREAREVFLTEPWGDNRRPPPGFERGVFHQIDGAETQCRDCHDLTPRPTDIAPPSPDRSSCFACHAGLTSYKYVHGPAAKWACTYCHDPRSAPTRYESPRPQVSELCFGCHKDMKDYFYGNPYQHGPAATGRCTICHNPHASDNPFWLKRPPWYLCTSCHAEKASGRHVIAWGPSGGTHPTRGKPDPMKPDRELACPSCHNPHAAPSPKLWNFGATRHTQLCQTCHTK